MHGRRTRRTIGARATLRRDRAGPRGPLTARALDNGPGRCHTGCMTSALRLNARLTPELGARLAGVQKRTGKTVTEIVHAALERYCTEAESAESAAAILDEVGLVGCANGPVDLSVDYKSHLARSLSTKASKARR